MIENLLPERSAETLNAFAGAALAVDRGAVPFQSFLDLARQGWFARGHELDEFVLGGNV